MGEAVFEASGLTKEFGEVTALRVADAGRRPNPRRDHTQPAA